ncbi:MAG: DNA-3-methyladenine glycosylase [Microthrixaceae bacterium]
MTTWRSVPAARLRGPVEEVAPTLLNTLVVVGDRVGRVVEVEAYGGAEDPASHAWRGPTPRNAAMFGLAGRLYVYRSYGLHWCANVVVGDEGHGAAVLLRGVEPVAGIEQMRRARGERHRLHDLTNGPGKLCAALGITGDDDGTDLSAPHSRVRLCRDATSAPTSPVVTARVGISRGTEHPWRFAVPGNPFVSRGRPARAA